uniref:Zinc finger protein 2 (inferred by orthology to a D. melanogaster protein) n=1 Tax=Nippostrongylus brasiliensis TaxID=27835 RepID=A0A0N4XQA8_NIPBR
LIEQFFLIDLYRNLFRIFLGASHSPKAQLDRLLCGAVDLSHNAIVVVGEFERIIFRNSSKTLKCPKCNWHYKYQETLEIHMKEKHAEGEVKCGYCADNRVHPKLARGESYSCGYKPYSKNLNK